MDIMTKIGPALEMMVQGMLGIFIVIGVIILFIVLLQKLTNRQPKNNQTKE